MAPAFFTSSPVGEIACMESSTACTLRPRDSPFVPAFAAVIGVAATVGRPRDPREASGRYGGQAPDLHGATPVYDRADAMNRVIVAAVAVAALVGACRSKADAQRRQK